MKLFNLLRRRRATQMIAGHIGESWLKELPDYYPPDNFIGGRIVHAVLAAEFERSGLLDPALPAKKEFSATGPLNDLVFMGRVTDALAAVDLAKDVLQRIKLLHISVIAFAAGDEWKSVFPKPGIPMDWLIDTERAELYIERERQIVDRFVRRGGSPARFKDDQTQGSEGNPS